MPVRPEDLSPNFVNPQYATPEQLASLREYSRQLMVGKGQQEVNRPSQGISNIVNALVGGYQSHQADEMQKQAISAQEAQTSPIIAALLGRSGPQMQAPQMQPPQMQPPAPQSSAPPMQGAIVNNDAEPSTGARTEVPSSPKVWGDREAEAAGLYEPRGQMAAPVQSAQNGQMDPRGLSAVLANPWVPKETKDLARYLVTPKEISNVFGQPGYVSPTAGVRLAPNANMPFGVKVPVSTPQGSTETIMTPPGQTGGSANYNMGGVRAPMEAVAQIGRDLGATNTLNTAAVAPQAEAIVEDTKNANQAPQIFRAVNTILDEINTHGDRMSWGPSSKYAVEIKKAMANFAPGVLGSDELKALAANESIEKATSTLGTLLGKQIGGMSGTDASMYQGLNQVPGAHNSMQGAKALADMIKQGTVLQQKLSEGYRALPNETKTNPNFDYIGFKNRFYQKNPILNPITGNDILMDMRERKAPSKSQDGWGIVR